MSGSPGALISLLDACLVNGYGSSVAAGWTKPFFTGATVAAYKQGAGSNGMYFKFFDTGTTWSNCYGAETMTDINTTTGDFPSPGTRSVSGYNPIVFKSAYGDSSAVPWMLVASEKWFMLFITSVRDALAIPNYITGFYCGDIVSERANDAYATAILSGTSFQYYDQQFAATLNNLNGIQPGNMLARAWYQLGNCVHVSKTADPVRAYTGTYPSMTDSQISLSPWVLMEGGIVRGRVPGIYVPTWNNGNGNTFTMVDGQRVSFTEGELAGKTFEAKFIAPSQQFLLIEISNTY
jgi:hypothetical protein